MAQLQSASFPPIPYTMEMREGVLAYWRDNPESAGTLLKSLSPNVLASEPISGLVTPIYHKELIAHFQTIGIPLVNTSNVRFAQVIPSVISDDRAVGRLAGTYLLQRGYRDFIFIHNSSAVFSAEREAGFREIVEGADCMVLTLNLPGTDGEWLISSKHQVQLQEIVQTALADGPQTSCRAVFCFSSDCALELLNNADEIYHDSVFRIGWMGVDAPQGKLTQIGNHRITAVRPDFFQIGYQGAALLAALMRGEAPPPGPIRVAPLEVVEGTTTPGPQGRDTVVATVLSWIETAIDNGDPLEVSQLAARANMSARTLQRRFTSSVGHGVKQEIYTRRMRKACEFLRSGEMSITDISVHIGYSNPGEFSRRFKRTFGLTPREWRHQPQNPSHQ